MIAVSRNLLAVAAMIAAAAASGCGGDSSAGGGFNLLKPSSSSSPDADSGWTIALKVFEGPTQAQDAARYKAETEKRAAWRDLYIMQQDEASILCRGSYRTLEAAQNDLKESRAFKAPDGSAIYGTSVVKPKTGKDVGPPEWNLQNVQGEYSVLVAVYQDAPQINYFSHKQDAVKCCQQFRSEGVEAYYLHEPARSCVTIGRFGKEAVVKRQQPMALLPGQTGPPAMVERDVIQDPRINQILRQYPHLLVNGYTENQTRTNSKTGQKEVIGTTPSCPIPIPHKKDATPNAQPQTPADTGPRNPQPWKMP